MTRLRLFLNLSCAAYVGAASGACFLGKLANACDAPGTDVTVSAAAYASAVVGVDGGVDGAFADGSAPEAGTAPGVVVCASLCQDAGFRCSVTAATSASVTLSCAGNDCQ